MAVELMLGTKSYRTTAFATTMEETAVKEAAAGLESVDKLKNLLSNSQNPGSSSKSDAAADYNAVADVAVSKFRRAISLMGRTLTGHARFRRGPLTPGPKPENPISDEKIYFPTPIMQIPPPRRDHPPPPRTTTINFSASGSGQVSGPSFLTGAEPEGTVVPFNSGFYITDMSRASSSMGKPPLPSSFKRKWSSDNGGGSSSLCHCSSSKKSRKMKLKRVVRVPAISLKMADIPTDAFSWRKYGQKPIKGSPHPRGYYKCSSVKGCPARKKVERAMDDPAMLVVTYEGDHNHYMPVVDSANVVIQSSVG